MLSVIRFLNAKVERPAEIRKQIVAVYGNVMNRQNVKKWCREFSEGRTDVHDEQRSGRPSLISDDPFQQIEGEIRANRRIKMKMIYFVWLYSGIQKLVPRINKCLTMPTTMLKNKVMYRQFIHSVAF